MSNRKLGLMVELRDPRALKSIRKALERGHGAKAAAIELGISRTTLTAWGNAWPAVRKMLTDNTLTPERVAELGVRARGQEVRK